MTQTTNQTDELIGVGEAADLLHVSPDTVARITDKLPPAMTTPGGHKRYRRADVEAYAEKLRTVGE